MFPLVGLLVAFYAWYYQSWISKTTSADLPLTKAEKINVLTCVIFSPVLAQYIFYYKWKKKFPQKAKQANRYGWICFGILIVLAIAIAEMYPDIAVMLKKL